MKVVVPEDHEVTVRLPSDFPAGVAEVIVLAAASPPIPDRKPFRAWLADLDRRLPDAPSVPLEALRRESLYEDD
jgi:hypothetical protein